MAVARALVALGWDERVAALVAELDGEDLEPARIVRVERGGGLAESAVGTVPVTSRAPLAVGDWVTLGRDERDHEVVGIAERWSQLARRDPMGVTQVLAANVDLVLVAAPADRLSPNRVEREVAVSWDSGARPIVLVTKSDLADPSVIGDLRDRLLGVDVVTTSVVTGEGLDTVATVLRPALTAVLLGPSGAGKSSIANHLLGDDRLEVGAVRDGDQRGRHTTSVRELVVLPQGGCLIDTPGLRGVALGEDHGGVDAAFPEIAELAAACRFGDCSHEHEPGCAVLEAVDAGRLDRRRLDNYRKLEAELSFEARRDDPLARAEAERVWKLRTKEYRAQEGRRGRPGR